MRTLLIVFLMLIPVPIWAQSTGSVPPTEALVYVVGASGDPLVVAPLVPPRVTAIASGAANCGLPQETAPTTPLVNPQFAYFDTPYGRCRAPVPTGLPDGTGYRGVVTLRAPSCLDPNTGAVVSQCETPRVLGIPNFNIAPILGPPAVPRNVVFK